MKRRNTFIRLGLAVLALFFAGCSNLSDTETQQSQDSNADKLTISLAPQGRYIQAGSYDLSSVSEWSMFLYAYNESASNYSSSYTYYLSWDSSSSTSSSTAPYLSYDKTSKVLTASHIQQGTYKVTITGSCTSDDALTYNITGSKEGIEISSKSSGGSSATIFVSLAKTGTGGLSLTLSNIGSKEYFSILANASATLTPHSSAGSTYSTSDSNSVLSISSTSSGYSLSADNNTIASGWYTLSFEYNGYSFYLADTEIEIADGIITTGTTEVSVAQETNFYATNDTSAGGNGLSVNSRINLTDLLTSFGASFPKESNINIYVDGDPEINLYALSLAEEKLAAETNKNKIVTIYNASFSIAIGIYASSSATAVADISAPLTITAGKDESGNEYKTLNAGIITVAADSTYTVTLKDGAAVNVSSDISSNLAGTLGICTVVSAASAGSTATDNFSAYTETPFLTAPSMISTDKIKLYDKDGNETSYSVVSTKSTTSDGTYTYTVSSGTSSYDGEISNYSGLSDAAAKGGTYLITGDITATGIVRVVNELTLVAEKAVTITRDSSYTDGAIFQVGHDGTNVQTGAAFTLGSSSMAAITIDGGGASDVTSSASALIAVAGSTVLTNVTFTRNYSSSTAGAVSITDADSSNPPALTANNCTFSLNKNTSSSNYGGAVLVTNCAGSISFTGCTFTGNNASNSIGGALAASGETTAEVSLSSCTFSENSAATYGKDIAVIAGAKVSLSSVTCSSTDNSNSGNVVTLGASILQVTDYKSSLGNIMGYTDSSGTTAGSTSDYGYLLYTYITFSQNIGTLPSSSTAMYFLSSSQTLTSTTGFNYVLTAPSGYSVTKKTENSKTATHTVGGTSYYVYELTADSN